MFSCQLNVFGLAHTVTKVSRRKCNTQPYNDEIYGLNVRRRKNTYRYLMSSHNIDGIVTWRDTSEILFFAK